MSTETTPSIGDLVRDWVIAVNEKRAIEEARKYGQATAEDVAQARDRVTAARTAVDVAMESITGEVHTQEALFPSEEIR